MESPAPTPSRLALPAGLARELVARARRAAPEECCGVLLGRSRPEIVVVEEAIAGANDAPGDRRTTYSIAVPDLLGAHERARARDLEVVGCYHSHPAGGPVPSASDRQRAWPDVIYLIVGLAPEPRLASWRFDPRGEPLRQGLVEATLEQNGGPDALQGETTEATPPTPVDER